MGQSWQDKLRRFGAFLAEFGVSHPIQVEPKRKSGPHEFVESDVGPTPRIVPSDWFDQPEVICRGCSGHILGQPIQNRYCAACAARLGADRRKGDAA